MSNLKTPIVKCLDRLYRATKGLPFGACYLCQQPAAAPVCGVCEQDCLFFNGDLTGPDLLKWPSIKRGLTPGNYHHLCALSYYQWPLDHLVRQFKYGHPRLSAMLVNWFLRYSQVRAGPRPDCLLPVPISVWRYAKRQYHQTLLLAQHLGKALDIPVIADWAHRKGWQVSQQSLGRKARLHNLKQAYQPGSVVLPRRVAIVDDVITTGATIATLSRMIRRCSPHTEVMVWALAITPVKPDNRIVLPGYQINQQAAAPSLWHRP